MAQSGTTDLGATIGSAGVTSLNSLVGALTLVAGTGITITPSGTNITITATGADALTNAHIYVGNASNIATDVPVSGDLTLINTGAFTIANLAVTNAKIANATIDLTTKVTGVLPIANGGTNNSTAYTAGSIIFSDGTSLTQDNANFFYDSGTQRLFMGANASIAGSNAGIQYSNATTANRGQIKLHSYFNGTSIAGVSTLTSRSGVVGTNTSISAGQDYSKWTAQAAAATPGSAPISGTFAFKANSINSLTVPSDFHIQLTNLAGTLGDRLYLSSEGLLQLPGYSTGVLHSDASGNITSSAISLTTDVSGILPIANGGTALSTAPANGQLLIGNGTNYTLSTLTAGSGISITNGAGSITLATSGQTNFTTKSANYTIVTTDRIIYVNSSGGAFNLTLPDPTTVSTSTTTQTFTIIDIGGTLNTNNVTLVRFGSEKIEGLAASKLLQTNWGAYRITTNNVDWFIS